MEKNFFALIVAVLLCAASSESYAQLHKCINSDGKATYTDQPCATKSGQKSVDTNDEAIRKITAISNFKNVEKSCWVLLHRAEQCSVVSSQDLRVVFRENCTLPSRKYETEQNSELRRTKKYGPSSEDGDDLEYIHRYTRKSRSVLRCESLDKDMWAFMNEHFAHKITETERKLITHQLHIAPTKKSSRYSSNDY